MSDRVRQKMREVLSAEVPYFFLNKTAADCLEDARRNYQSLDLLDHYLVNAGRTQYLFPWMGDWVKYTIQLALQYRGFDVQDEGLCLAMDGENEKVIDALIDFRDGAFPSEMELAEVVFNKHCEKWD